MPRGRAPEMVTAVSPRCIFTIIKDKVNEALVSPLFPEDSMCYVPCPYLRTDRESKSTTVMQKQEGSLSLAR